MPLSPRRLAAAGAALLAVLFGSGGAWTRPAGDGFASQSFRYYSTELSASSEVDYARFTVGAYVEYGVTDWLTVGADLDQGMRTDVVGAGRQGGGVAAFGRVRLWSGAAGDALSVQIGASLPAAALGDAGPPQEGDDAREYKAMLQYGRGASTPIGAVWAEGAAGYARLTAGRADEMKLDLTAGIRPDDNWIGMVQTFGAFGRRTAAFGQPDFDVVKLKLSAGRRVLGEKTLLLGLQRDVYSNGLTPGWEASLSVWSTF